MDGPLLAIDRLDERPVVAQVVDAMRHAILTGALQPGDRVASTRVLAAELGTARSSVVSAYEQLAGEGYLELRQGAPTLVAPLGERPGRSAGGSSTGGTTGGTTRGTTGGSAGAGTAGGTHGAGRTHGDSRTSPDSGNSGTRPASGTSPDGPGPGPGIADVARRRPPAASGTAAKPSLAGVARPIGLAPAPATTTPRIDLRPGRPSTSRIDERAWRSAWRRAAAVAVPVDDPPRLGEPLLRAAIADHVRHARGFACEPGDILVTAGTSEATSLIGTALGDLIGARPLVAVEDPGYPNARRMLARAGAELVPVEVGDDGLRVDLLRRLPRSPDAILVTPSHQYPLGGRLPVAARLELLEHARLTGAFVLEDDYDSEFRHVGPPMPTLASLDGSTGEPGETSTTRTTSTTVPTDAAGARPADESARRENRRVVLIGSFSKILTPWLRLGYAVLPRDEGLRAAVERVRTESPPPVPGIVQIAVAHLLTSGALRRHIAATRRDYAHRRRLLLAALGDLPATELVGLDGGLHAVLRLPRHDVVDAVVGRLDAAGIAVARLSDYSAGPGDGQAGIALGYAGVGDRDLADALARIRAVVLEAV